MHGPLQLSTGCASEDEVVVDIASTFAEVEALRCTWNCLGARHVDSEIDYFMVVVANADQVISPYVIRIQRPGRPDMLIAARLEQLPVRFRLAYATLGTITVRAIVVTFDGVIGTDGPSDEAAVMQTLIGLLEKGEADVILMRNVDPSTSLHRAARSSVSSLQWGHHQGVDRLWRASLAPSLDAFLSNRSAKSRSSFRREDRLLRERFGDRLRLHRFRLLDELDKLCLDMQAVSARTYLAGLGAGFYNTRMERAIIEHGLRLGTYCCWMLYVDERPIAYWAGIGYRGVFYPTTPGFDPEFGEFSVGRYTMFRMIEDLCADPDYSWLDFGRGDAQYKSEYGMSPCKATDVWIAATRPWPILIVGGLSLTGLINQLGKRWIEKLEWGKRLKNRWRQRLQDAAQKVRS